MSNTSEKPGLNLRTKIKQGLISPDDALNQLKGEPSVSPWFIKWAKRTGWKRYKLALNKSEQAPEPAKPVAEVEQAEENAQAGARRKLRKKASKKIKKLAD